MELSGYQYNCSGGETWDSIAREVYEDEKYAAEIICANPQYSGKAVFSGGEALLLPLVAMPDDADAASAETPPWKEA